MNETTSKNPQEAIAAPSVSVLDKTRTLEIIAGEIRTFTASMLNNIIEIGRRMCEAKEMLPYGKFGDWIEENTGYSRSTANNYMRVFQEYGTRQGSLFGATVENDQAFGKLTYTKALALLDVPAEEREAFVADHDVENMSTRELQAAIAERDKALEKENKALKKQLAELEKRPVEVVQEQEAVDKAVAEAVKKVNDAHIAELEKVKSAEEKKRKSLEKKVEAAEKAAKAAEEKASVAGKTADGEAENLRAEAKKLQEEADNLRRELALSGEAAVTFKTHFALWQQEYRSMTEALKRADEETAGKFRAAINAQMEGWKNG